MQKPVFVPGVFLGVVCAMRGIDHSALPLYDSELTEEALSETERMVRSVRENPLSLRKMVDEMVDAKMQKVMAK